ncbi:MULTISPECIES: galactonate dehydratase [Parabacteroides]|jgi:galactonate dehydratase|uniref:Galactonate dehydratase n=1 Tax=Parabacteroides segnis TaxID=2763058 RepID=A0ABR7DXD1_9BACT|nr:MULTISPECIES: galactonate dehydratase [Parabacteroides]MBC5642170.1 galactonate dehydratase [Parabacteroides segnis]MCM0713214.1 galactonate dehydratase [Parabacteroides sp. TA-V-105]
MIIEKFTIYKVPPRWVFLKITTKSGYEGWGEPLVEGRADTVIAAVKEFESCLIGKRAGDIEDIFQMLYRGGFYRGGPVLMSAISGIEQALWDIKGKALGVPVYELLGGRVRDKMRVYTWIGGDTPSEVIKGASQRLEQGYNAIKMNGCGKMDWLATIRDINLVKDQLKELRAEFGDKLDIGIDFHGRVHKPVLRRLVAEMEPYYPMFFEEPVLPQHNEILKSLSQYTSIPIATGERMYTRWDFKQILTEGSVDIIQPDLSHAGGLWETRKIAAMAEAYDVAVALHCPLGPIAFSAALQFDFSTPNAVIQESSLGIHYNLDGGCDLLDYVTNKEDYSIFNGFISCNDKPGLGVVVDEYIVKEMAKQGHDWHNPVWRTEDGTIAEW